MITQVKLLLFSFFFQLPPSRQARHGGTTKKALTKQEPRVKSGCFRFRTFIYFFYYAKTVFDLNPKGLILRKFCAVCPLSGEVKKIIKHEQKIVLLKADFTIQ